VSEQQHPHRSTDSGGWHLQKRDGVYALLLAASVGGGQALDARRHDVPSDLSGVNASIDRLEKSLNELRDPGGPKLRETVLRVTALEQHNASQQSAIDAINSARFNDLKNGVTQETVSDLRQRLADDREAQRDLKAQVEALRAAIDNLRSEIMRATTARLRGPER